MKGEHSYPLSNLSHRQVFQSFSYLFLTIPTFTLHCLHYMNQPIYKRLLGCQKRAHNSDRLITLREWKEIELISHSVIILSRNHSFLLRPLGFQEVKWIMINFPSIQKVFSVKHNHSHCSWQSIIWPNTALQFASTISVVNSHAWQTNSHSQNKLVWITVKYSYRAQESDSSNPPKTGNNIKCEIHENL